MSIIRKLIILIFILISISVCAEERWIVGFKSYQKWWHPIFSPMVGDQSIIYMVPLAGNVLPISAVVTEVSSCSEDEHIEDEFLIIDGVVVRYNQRCNKGERLMMIIQSYEYNKYLVKQLSNSDSINIQGVTFSTLGFNEAVKEVYSIHRERTLIEKLANKLFELDYR